MSGPGAAGESPYIGDDDFDLFPKPETEADSDPVLVEVMDGWFAVGCGWAVVGATKPLAIAKYREAQRLHAEIASRVESARCEP